MTGRDDGGDAFARVVAAVRERVDPSADERARMERVADRLVSRTEDAVADLSVEADVLRVGSTARDTWTSGDHDVDIFVRFSPDLDRSDLERYGLRVGHRVLPDGEEAYAEHPYVTGVVEGFDVDLVPCYAVADAAAIRSAVDRTPFHTAYVEERLDDDLAAEVRVCKQFLKGVGVYGSDLRTRGFSGYLTELLVLEYGGFRALLSAASDWTPPVRLDPENHGTREFDDPLVVVDPTDAERNVAAVVSSENVARLQHHARAFLEDPTVERFFPDPLDPLTAAAVRTHLDRRATHPLAVVFDAPDLVEDQLYPQLRRSLRGLVGALDDRGFEPLRAATFADDRAVLLVECAVAELPAVERHEGPPVHVADHATGFYEAYADDPDVYGPFVDGERYVIERPREVRRADAFAETRLFDVALGAAVERSLEEGYEVVTGDALATLADEFGADLARYFDPEP